MNSSGRVLKPLLLLLLLALVAGIVLLVQNGQTGQNTAETPSAQPGIGPADLELPFATELV